MRFAFAASGCLAALLALGCLPGRAQAPARADSLHPRPVVLKGGLNVTQLSTSSVGSNWQLPIPLALSIEYRLGARLSLTTQFDADLLLTGKTARRRRAAAGSGLAIPALALGVGGRYYYGSPAEPAGRRPEFGRYLALEAGATLASVQATGAAASGRRGGSRLLLTPSLYALWGVQRRLRPHLLYDLSAGLGVLAPVRIMAEHTLPGHGWDVGVQANVRLYFSN